MRKFFPSRFRFAAAALLAAVFATACHHHHAPPNGGDAQPPGVVSLAQNPTPADVSPKDAPRAITVLFQVDIYTVSVPRGTFSSNEPFWRRIDEQCVDFATHDVLMKNGIRVGAAPVAEFDHFKRFIDANTPAKNIHVTAASATDLALPVQQNLPEQTIYYFDGTNYGSGRTYDRCENILSLSFAPTPRKAGFVRVKLCPMIKSMRHHLEFADVRVNDNDTMEREIQYVAPEYQYDLNLVADLAPDTFLVVAPSEEARDKTTMGGAFLMRDGPTAALEQIVLIVPRPYGSANLAR